ncbi:hypothetical protein [Marinomonas pollencensis]|uniref:Uncharacterized protein n=1 Tax=Marinomonas pollencensis TaxID=491954 RepID=A0A3E0DHL9_9GAMM|nr:hypothetical protein [Marinomonas pollencensis]REG81582.1 hypothetical protein DFP81_1135 [Marinomonas pollencensis]
MLNTNKLSVIFRFNRELAGNDERNTKSDSRKSYQAMMSAVIARKDSLEKCSKEEKQRIENETRTRKGVLLASIKMAMLIDKNKHGHGRVDTIQKAKM